jgi:hypothetical protein
MSRDFLFSFLRGGYDDGWPRVRPWEFSLVGERINRLQNSPVENQCGGTRDIRCLNWFLAYEQNKAASVAEDFDCDAPDQVMCVSD